MERQMTEIRPITSEERRAFMQVGEYSFGQWKYKPAIENLDWIQLDETQAVFVGGMMAARLRNRTFTQIVRGIEKPISGIASVASYPEFRRRGYIRQLMEVAFADMRAKGQVISALYPFKQGFYRNFGYVNTNSYFQIKIPTTALAHHLPLPPADDGRWTLTRHPAEETHQSLPPFVQEMAREHHGFVILPADLPKELWNLMREDEQVLFVHEEGRLQGALRYSFKGFMDDGTLAVRTMYWRDRPTRDIILAFLATHVDNARFTWLPIPPQTNYQYWLADVAPPIEAKTSYMALMVRVMDVPGALANLPAAIEGEIIFAYTDPLVRQNDGVYRLVGDNGRLHAHRHHGPAVAHFSVEGLSALVFGAAPIEELLHREWISAPKPVLQLLQVWFPEQQVYNPNFF